MAIAERHKKRLDKRYTGFLFIGPAIILLLVVAIFPLLNTFILSFQGLEAGKWVFVGFDNFKKLFNDEWRQNDRNTFLPCGYNNHLSNGMLHLPFINDWISHYEHILAYSFFLAFSRQAGSLMCHAFISIGFPQST